MRPSLALAAALLILACNHVAGTGDDDSADTETETGTGPDGDTDSDVDSDADGDADSDMDGDTDTDTDGDTESESYADSDTDLPEGEVLCGWGVCFTPEICCVTESPPTQECMTPSMCSGDFLAMCDGPEDCGDGGECCMPTGGISSSWCSTDGCMVTACHNADDCPDADHCCDSVFFGYTIGVCSTDPC